jgi:hypothetical protein
MKKSIFIAYVGVAVLFVILQSCGGINTIATQRDKSDKCFYDKDGVITPYKTDKYRVTERYLFAPEKK